MAEASKGSGFDGLSLGRGGGGAGSLSRDPDFWASQIGTVKTAFVEAYPGIFSSDFELPVHRVRFCSLEEAQQAEWLARPKSNMVINKILGIAGVLEDDLSRLRYSVSPSNPNFVNYSGGIMYVDGVLGSELISGNLARASNAINFVAKLLIRANVRALGSLNPVNCTDEESMVWRKVFGSRFKKYVGDLVPNITDDKLDEAASLFSIDGMMEHRGRFVYCGAKVVSLFGEQSIAEQEFDGQSSNFDLDTIAMLADPIERVFFRKLSGVLGIIKSGHLTVSKGENPLIKYYRRLGLVGNKSIFESYKSAGIARRILESDEPEVDPYNFGELVDPNIWLHRFALQERLEAF